MLCAKIEQTLTGELTTRTGTLDQSPETVGEGEVFATVGEQSAPLMLLRGTAGMEEDAYGNPLVVMYVVAGPIDESNVLLLNIVLPRELFEEGNTVRMDFGECETEVALVDMATGDYKAYGFVITGELTFEEIEDTENGAFVMSFEAPIGVIQL